jgi:hypothetical protein
LGGVLLAVHRPRRIFVNPQFQAAAAAMLVAVGAQYLVVDAEGRVVGTLVTDSAATSQMRVIGITNAPRTATPQQPDKQTDRTFHPDYSKALTPDQMTGAWQAELDRINPPIVTGGG